MLRQFVVDYCSVTSPVTVQHKPKVLRGAVALLRREGVVPPDFVVKTQTCYWLFRGYDVEVFNDPADHEVLEWCCQDRYWRVIELRGRVYSLFHYFLPWETDGGKYIYFWPKITSRRPYHHISTFPPFQKPTEYTLKAQKTGSPDDTLTSCIGSMKSADLWLITRLCLAKHQITQWRSRILSATGTRELMSVVREITGRWKGIEAPFQRACKIWNEASNLPLPVHDLFSLCAEELWAFTAIFFPPTVEK